MGPLASTAVVEAQRKVQRADIAAIEKERRERIKMLNDEARKERMQQIKEAKEKAKAETEGLPLEKHLPETASPKRAPLGDGMVGQARGAIMNRSSRINQAVDGMERGGNIPNDRGQGTVRVPNSAPLYAGPQPTNPEAGPSDRRLAAVAPGEAIIPAPLAQHPMFKGLISNLVEKGREMLDQYRGQAQAAPLGGMSGQAKEKLMTRKQRLDAAEKASLGYERGKAPLGFNYGTDGLTDEQTRGYESNNNPAAKNPESSAYGLYQITDAAREDVHKVRPELAYQDFKQPKVQEEYRKEYKDILARRLEKKGIDVNLDNINRAWVVGDTGLEKIAKAEPTQYLEEILSDEAIAKNPNLWGKTVQHFMTDKNPYSRMDGKGPQPIFDKPTYAAGPKVPPSPSNVDNPEVKRIEEALARIGENPLPGLEKERSRLLARRAELLTQTPTVPHPLANSQVRAVDQQTMNDISQVVPPPREEIPAVEASDTAESTEGTLERPDPSEVKNLVKMTTESDDMAARWDATEAQVAAMKREGKDEKSIKDYLVGAVQGIYGGENSLFNDRDLLKFAILTAGGLLTGGSVAGSVRYAGNAIFKDVDQREAWANQEKIQERAATNADKRMAAREKAQSAAADRREKWRIDFDNAKDIRERFQVFENKFHELNKDTTPEAREEALKYYSQAVQEADPNKKNALMRGALTILSSSQVDRNTTKDTKPDFGRNDQGQEGMYYITPDKQVMFKPVGSSEYKPYSGSVMSPSEWQSKEKEVRDGVNARVKAALSWRNDRKPVKDFKVADHADGVTESIMALRREMPNVSREAFGEIVENAMWNLKESRDPLTENIHPGAIRKFVLGNAVIATRMADAEGLYKANGKRPAPEATVSFMNAIDSRAKNPAERDKVIADLEGAYKRQSKAVKDKYEAEAKALKGWSPFLLWVRDNDNK